MLKGKLKILEQGGWKRPSATKLRGKRLEPLRARRFTKGKKAASLGGLLKPSTT
jgi:hypothetical protein